MNVVASFLCGLVFGLGLVISGMTQPSKVLGFLDVLGRWDPTLAFVMAGAVSVSGTGYLLMRRLRGPMFAERHLWPRRSDIDSRLTIGALLFGAGWGLAGVCPGPALVNLATLSPGIVLFVLAMIGGMALQGLWVSPASSRPAAPDAALASSDG